MFVREADEALLHRAGDRRGRRRHVEARLPRLRAPRARAASRRSADAAWVGWGFVAEHPEFAELCEKLGIVFVGPTPTVDAPARRQDRRQAPRRGGRRAGRAVERRARSSTVDEARHRPARIGFPLMIKATAGGGGRGIRRVDTADGARARRSSAPAPRPRRAFGDPTVFMERLVGARPPRRGADHRRRARRRVGGRRARLHLQRRHQKVVEESRRPRAHRPSRTTSCARPPMRLAREAGYRNAGTVEFLYQPDERPFASWRSTRASRSSTP